MCFANWFKYYDALPTSSAMNMGKMQHMLKSFDASLSTTETCATTKNKKDLFLLARKGLNKSLGLFHCLEVSGGTVVNTEEECAFIFGLNQNNAIVVTPDIG